MRDGYSWSGHEANVCFLNTGGSGFADASSVTGFDFPDDSRGLALVDWDHDGDLDVWLTNRTAPMVRYLENSASDTSASLIVKLKGVRSNRDAIGARATLTLRSDRQITRGIRAGEGYLSQSSKYLHFAWRSDDAPTSLNIVWPNGEQTTHSMAGQPRRLTISEDSQLTSAPSQEKVVQEASPQIVRSARRVVSMARPWFPRTDLEKGIVLGEARNRPQFVQLWAPWCAPCMQERLAFAQAKLRFRSAQLDLLAVCVDRPPKDNYPFPQVASRPELLDALEVLQRSMFDRSEALGLPLSLLLDKSGRLVCLYPGSVSPDQVLEDLKLIGTAPTSRLALAQPFPGQWLNAPPSMDPMKIALSFFAAGKKRRALAYLERLVGDPSVANIADLHAFRGSLLDGAERVASYQAALDVDPKHLQSLRALGNHFLDQRAVRQAGSFFQRILSVQPTDSEALFGLAQIHFARGDLYSAMNTLRQLVRHHPSHWTATNNLAWILATHAKDELRNGPEALQLARMLPLDQEPTYSDTLAAALAETGAFQEALQVIASALLSADATSHQKLIKRQRAYREKRPWRENP